MSQRAVREFIRTLLEPIPDLEVFDSKPKIDPITDQVVIWSISTDEAPWTQPDQNSARGTKKCEHTVELLVQLIDPDSADAAHVLDDHIQDVKTVCREAALPAVLTDTHSGERSRVMQVGKRISTRPAVQVDIGPGIGEEGLQYANTMLRVSVLEQV